MNHNQINTDVTAIRRAYGQFLEKGVVPEGIVPDFIKRSWQRSVAFGVPSDRIREVGRIDETDLRVTVSQYGSLINLAAPVMENLHHQLTGSGSVVLLCSGDGLILHSMGDPDFIPRAQHVALKPGVSWAEEQKGTNAIGTAIVEREPVVIYAAHHFIRQNHFLACSATPVLDPSGDVAGVLDITCDYRGHQRHTIALVQMAVRVIERQVFQHRFCRDVVFNVHPERNYLGSPFDVQVAFSPHGVYLAATPATCGQLDLRPGAFRGLFDELFDASFAQVLRKLGSVSPPVIQVRLRHNGMPVYLQLAQPTMVAKAGHGTPVASPAQKRQTAFDGQRSLHELTLDTLGASDTLTLFNIEKARRTLGRDIPILIEGETGVGKEWLARAIHNSGRRAGGEFVALNCAAISEGPLEAELFGYEEGAFGAKHRAAISKIQRADGGTLFLDEIGDMPLHLQARLLRVLQERAITPLDGKPVNVDLAVICATHHKLHDLVREGSFREDLYYRLNGLTLFLPPLRERKDLLELARALAAKECVAPRCVEISAEVTDIFAHHPWPGNLRQMHSVIRTALAMVDAGEKLERRHLPEDFLEELAPTPVAAGAREPVAAQAVMSSMYADSLEQIELQAIQETIRHCNGNISAAARQLNVSRTTLYRKLKHSPFATPGPQDDRRGVGRKRRDDLRG
ncbi:MAG TPA: sigma-54-dependent Fis family transcriptional regulator [Burkholderiales bacterium]|jgi:transcriptional regulator of acetoin/glycerol metabolism|nr:sigma-54-dependent Fis family transcriptional regulator [Burkholderiales bacterium]